MVTEAAAFLVPAATMPVTSEIRCIPWDNDEMTNTDIDGSLTAWACIGLARLIRLNGVHSVIIERIVESRRLSGIACRRCHGGKGRREAAEHPCFVTSIHGSDVCCTLARHGRIHLNH